LYQENSYQEAEEAIKAAFSGLTLVECLERILGIPKRTQFNEQEQIQVCFVTSQQVIPNSWDPQWLFNELSSTVLVNKPVLAQE
jgi:hypothetical protein